MELSSEHKDNPGSLVFMLSSAYRRARDGGMNEQEFVWAETAGAVNRFCRQQAKADPRWKRIEMAIFNIWKSYFRILSVNTHKSLFRKSRIKSEERILQERIEEFNRQAKIWEGIKNGE